MKAWIKRIISIMRYGKVKPEIICFASDHVPCEILFYARFGIVVGFWCCGYYDPSMGYQGEQD